MEKHKGDNAIGQDVRFVWDFKMGFKNSYEHLSGLSNCYLQKDEPVARYCRVVKVENPGTSQIKMGLRVSQTFSIEYRIKISE